MEDLEDRPSDCFFARNALHTCLALSVPHRNAVVAIDHVEPDRQRVDDPLGHLPLAIDLCGPFCDFAFEALCIRRLAKHGCEDVRDGGEEGPLIGTEWTTWRDGENAERMLARIEPN